LTSSNQLKSKGISGKLLIAFIVIGILLNLILIYLAGGFPINVTDGLIGVVTIVVTGILSQVIANHVEKILAQFNQYIKWLLTILLTLFFIFIILIFVNISKVISNKSSPLVEVLLTPMGTIQTPISLSPTKTSVVTPMSTPQIFTIIKTDMRYHSDKILCGSNISVIPANQMEYIGFTTNNSLGPGMVKFRGENNGNWVFIQFNNPQQIFILGRKWPEEYTVCGVWSYFEALTPKPDLPSLESNLVKCGDLCKSDPH